MGIVIGNEELYIDVTTNIFVLAFKKEIINPIVIYKTNKISTFLSKINVDIIAFNNKNYVIYKYQDVPKNKLIEIKNDKKNTNILVLPKNISKYIKIGDALSFINENII